MADLIDRRAAIEKLISNLTYMHTFGADRSIDLIEELPSIQPEHRWIPCSERLPEEDHWLGGSGNQFSEKMLVSIANHEDEDIFVDVTYTMNGEWMLGLPRYCEIVAWMPLPEPYKDGEQNG